MGLEGTRFDLKTLPEELRDTTRWPDVDIGALHGRKRKKYLQRREAIQLYFKGEDKVVDICTKCKISDTFLHYLRDRCLMDHRNGWIWGFRALVPGQHVEIQGRTKPVSVQPEGTKSGYRGALTQLFDRYPSIWRYVRALFLKKARQMEGSIAESRAPYKSIHKKFIDACRSKGLKGSDYPLCTDDQGRKSLTKHLNNLFNSDMEAAVAAQFGKDAARKLGSGEDYKKTL